jgi:E3 ubiquitin-protein ligase SHPRH
LTFFFSAQLREADDLIDILNRQTGLLFTWRQRIFDLLTEDLVKKDEEKADGEEFARSLETQGVAETYLQAYSALIADRREVMLLERSALAAHDARELKLRQTAAAKKAAESLYGMSTEQDVAIDLEPDLHVQLATARKNIMEAYDKRALRSIIVDLMHVVHSIAAENDPEKLIAQDWASQLRRLIAEQGKP